MFWLEWTSDEEFKIASKKEGYEYVTNEKGCIKVKRTYQPFRFRFAESDAKTINDWIEWGSRLEIQNQKGFLGYNNKRDLMEIFPSDADEEPDEIALHCQAKQVDIRNYILP